MEMPCEFVCNIEIEVENACELEVYSVPEEEHAFIETESTLLQRQVQMNSNLDSIHTFEHCTDPPKFSASNQVLPLLTSVYAERKCEEELGLAAEYCAALQQEGNECRTCQMCGELFLSATRLLHHVKQEHKLPNFNLHQCFVCRQRYIFPVALVQHLHQFHALSKPHLTCSVCCTQLGSCAELKAHLRKHALTEACTLCFAHFASPHRLAEHMDVQHAKPFPCTGCRQGFWQMDILKQHEARHEAMGNLSCVCDWQASDCIDPELTILEHIAVCSPQNLQQLLEQARKEDQEEVQLDNLLKNLHLNMDTAKSVQQCVKDVVENVGSFLDVNTDQHQQEQQEESDIYEFQCQICSPNSVWGAEELMTHVLDYHARSKACALCRKRFSTTQRAQAHAKRHIAARQKNQHQEFHCQHCDKQLPSRSKLNLHLESIHKITVVDRPFACSHCPRKFVFAANRDKHVAIQHQRETADANVVIHCLYCDASFIKPKYLLRHEEKYHPKPENPAIKCNLCDQQMENRAKLRRHMAYVHGPAADTHRYQCPECPVGCRTASGLQAHIRVHTGERPYACPICSKTFKRMQAMTSHQRNIHGIQESSSALKVHCCTMCPTRLSSNAAMTKHFTRSHRNLRRFICGICGERLCQNQQLRQHMEVKHQTVAPTLTSDRRQMSHIHVYPAIDKLPASHPHSQLITQLIEEEQKKTEDLPTFPTLMLPFEDVAQQRNLGRKSKSAKTTTKKENEVVSISIQPMPFAGSSFLNLDNLDNVISENLTCNISNQVINTISNSGANIDEYCTVAVLSDNIDKNIGQELSNINTLSTDTYINILNADSSNPNNITFEVVSSWSKGETMDMVELQPIKSNLELETEAVFPQLRSCDVLQFQQQQQSLQVQQFQEACDTTQMQQNLQTLEFMCVHPNCNKTFADKSRLERHKKIHLNTWNFMCTVCNKGFREKHNLVVHMRSHSGVRPYHCDECGSNFRYQQQLLEHQRCHRGERPYSCSHCPDRSFIRLRDLKRHLSTHTSTSGFKCPICDKTLSRKDTLQQHIRVAHYSPIENSKPIHECKTCGKSFHSALQLQQHRVLHLGSKDYVCSQCGKGFALKSYLSSHIRTHNRRNNYLQCSLCPRKFTNSRTLEVHQTTFHVPGRMQQRRQQNDEAEKDVEEHEAVLLHVLADTNFDLH